MATVYILHSKSIDKYYIGSCLEFENRLNQHNSHTFNKSFTLRATDWELFYKIDNLNYQSARLIERHIKNMKSKKYILNLIENPEISKKLIDKYS